MVLPFESREDLEQQIKWVFPKIGKHPKMDGENNGKPGIKMDDLAGKPTIFGNTQVAAAFFFSGVKQSYV